MPRLSDISTGKSIFGMFYGSAGTGKTWLCGTGGDRVLYCNVENRLATLQSPKFQSMYKFNPIVITVSEEHLPENGAHALVELREGINEQLEKHIDEFDTIILDGATALRRFAMNVGLELNQKTGKSNSLKNKASFSPDYPAVDIAVNDYQMEMNLIENWIYRMKETCVAANKHFFMTAHERVELNPPSKLGAEPTVRAVRPGFTGQKFPDTIPGMFDLVWHTEIKNGRYCARTNGDSILIAKTCFNGIFNEIEYDPTIKKLISQIQSSTPSIKSS